jgi:Mn2+/Fe2+ NRAMP family transporter
MKLSNLQNFYKTLGPGILFASTAIGVSHLVQSTRAGAEYGMNMIFIVLVANILKYPFFEFGSRYANATGTSLIDGYLKIGKWMLWLYLFITVLSMFFVCAAVGMVTAGFLDNLFGIHVLVENSLFVTTFFLFIVCVAILYFGNYSALDKLIKIMGSVMVLTTITAFILSVFREKVIISGFISPSIFQKEGLIFLIALIGWMPTAVDLSAWNSLWTVERIKETGYKPTLKETLSDFGFGYFVSTLLSVCFVYLGAKLLFGTGKIMPTGTTAFANEVVHIFTTSIGDWSYLLIASAAFTIMFGTCIAVFDGYSRAIQRVVILLKFKSTDNDKSNFWYRFTLILIAFVSFVIISNFGNNITSLVDFATSLSFVIAPIIAMVNYRLVSKKFLSETSTPPIWLHVLSWTGIIFLVGFTFVYIVFKLI